MYKRQDKPSGSLVRRLGLGRIDDRGAGLGKKGKTAFAAAYRGGEISRWLRVDQNGSVPKLAFATSPGDVPLDRCLPLCFTGLSEVCHPFCLLARQGAKQLLEAHPNAEDVVPTLLPSLVPSLRAALADKEPDVVEAAMDVVSPLAAVVGAALAPFLDRLLPPIARKAAGGPLARKALDALRASTPATVFGLAAERWAARARVERAAEREIAQRAEARRRSRVAGTTFVAGKAARLLDDDALSLIHI